MTTSLKAILGSAGTGKSYYINQLVQKDPKFALRTATTGMAALNLGSCRGASEPTTINSALGFFDAESLLKNYISGKTFRPLSLIAKQYKNIVLDEVSLINAAVLDLIVLALDQFNEESDKKLGLLISGDVGQLAPVEGSPFFKAKCWSKFEITYLTEVKRQENKSFIEALNLIRKGKIQEALPWFKENITFVDKVDPHFRGTTFFSTNNEVNMYNRHCLTHLAGKSKIYTAQLTGVPHPTWSQIFQELEVKQNSIIQLLYNNLERGFANGDTAIVNELWDNALHISLLRKNKEIFLRPRELFNYTLTAKGYFDKTEAAGTLKVIHAKLANSSTVHRAQGLTLDHVQLCLKGAGQQFLSKQSGMLYTALSRVRTPEGLILIGTPEDLIKCCYVNPNYLEWIR